MVRAEEEEVVGVAPALLLPPPLLLLLLLLLSLSGVPGGLGLFPPPSLSDGPPPKMMEEKKHACGEFDKNFAMFSSENNVICLWRGKQGRSPNPAPRKVSLSLPLPFFAALKNELCSLLLLPFPSGRLILYKHVNGGGRKRRRRRRWGQEQEMPSAGGIMKSHASSSLLSLHLATGKREARFREVGTTFDKLAVNYTRCRILNSNTF